MDAQYTILGRFFCNDCTKWHPLEQIIHLLEDTVWFFNIFIESLGTFSAKSKVFVDVSVFMIASQQENLTGILKLEGQ